MLYTVVPTEVLFYTAAADYSYRGGGSRWLCVREYQGTMTVERLISTDPFDYLKPGTVPGAELKRDGRLNKKRG